jgi:VanZ family protein
MLFKKLIPSLAWALFIMGLCALPGSAIPELTFLQWLRPDKIVHLVLFGVLSFLLIKAFTEQSSVKVLNGYPKIISIIVSALYGVLIEVLQEYCFIGRQGDVFDAMADTLGAFIGWWFFNEWYKRRQTKRVS